MGFEMIGLDPFMAVCVTLNLLMGSGFLALPTVFRDLGIIPGVCILLVTGCIMYVTCVWEGRGVLRAKSYEGVHKVPEVTEALRIFCNPIARSSYLGILSLSLIGSVWAYAILFGQCMSSELPIIYPSVSCDDGNTEGVCGQRYLFYLVLLAILTTPLSLVEVKDQAWFQLVMTGLRILLICIMSATALYAYFHDAVNESFPNHESIVRKTNENSIPSFSTALLSCISTCVFSLYLNSTVPLIAHAIADKSTLGFVISRALLCSCVLYGTLAVVCGLCFGNGIDNPVNLNWKGYSFAGRSSVWSKAIEALVLLFPAMDVLSVYPLTTIALSNNLLEAVYGVECVYLNTQRIVASLSCRWLRRELHSLHRSVTRLLSLPLVSSSAPRAPSRRYVPLPQDEESSPWGTETYAMLVVRVVVNVFPIACAFLIPNFLFIVNYVGGISVLVCFVYPALLSMASAPYTPLMPTDEAKTELVVLYQALDDPMPSTTAASSSLPTADYWPPTRDWVERRWLAWTILSLGSLLATLIVTACMIQP